MALKLNRMIFNYSGLCLLLLLMLPTYSAKGQWLSPAEPNTHETPEIKPTENAKIDKQEMKKQADRLNFEELEEIPDDPTQKQNINIKSHSAGTVGLSKTLIYAIAFILLLIIVIFAIYQLSRPNSKIKNEELVSSLSETDPQNLMRFRLTDSLASALAEGNHKLAVRLLYLNLLKILMEKGLITPSAEKTNFEYVRELNANVLQNDFNNTTLVFEQAWYGKGAIDATKYQFISQSFSAFENKINQAK